MIDCHIKTEMSQGSIGVAVGILTPAIFKTDRQHEKI